MHVIEVNRIFAPFHCARYSIMPTKRKMLNVFVSIFFVFFLARWFATRIGNIQVPITLTMENRFSITVVIPTFIRYFFHFSRNITGLFKSFLVLWHFHCFYILWKHRFLLLAPISWFVSLMQQQQKWIKRNLNNGRRYAHCNITYNGRL